MLHIRCGTDIETKLAAAGLPGAYLSWHDPLSQGPCPGGASREVWRPARAEFIARAYGGSEAEVLGWLTVMDAELARAEQHDEVVLWFEHDLFDQAILAYLLDGFATRSLGATRLSMVTLDRHPEVPRFIGLGNLGPQQLAALFAERRPVTPAMLADGRRIWAAYSADDPRALEAIVAEETGALPFARRAFRRHLEEFPATANDSAGPRRWRSKASRPGPAPCPTPSFICSAPNRRPGWATACSTRWPSRWPRASRRCCGSTADSR